MSPATRFRFHPHADPAFYPVEHWRWMVAAGVPPKRRAAIMRRCHGPLWRLRMLW